MYRLIIETSKVDGALDLRDALIEDGVNKYDLDIDSNGYRFIVSELEVYRCGGLVRTLKAVRRFHTGVLHFQECIVNLQTRKLDQLASGLSNNEEEFFRKLSNKKSSEISNFLRRKLYTYCRVGIDIISESGVRYYPNINNNFISVERTDLKVCIEGAYYSLTGLQALNSVLSKNIIEALKFSMDCEGLHIDLQNPGTFSEGS